LNFVWHFICRGGVAGGRIRPASQYLSEDAAANPRSRQVSCARLGVRENLSQNSCTCSISRLLLTWLKSFPFSFSIIDTANIVAGLDSIKRNDIMLWIKKTESRDLP
jgi:hypothetical protein